MEDIYENHAIQEEGIDILRYFKVLIRRWWIIGLIFLIVSVPWILHVLGQPDVFEAEAMMYFENVSGQEGEKLTQARRWKLTSPQFLEEVTAKLGLTLEMVREKGIPDTLRRQHVFQTFSTSHQPRRGDYTLRFYPTGDMAVYYEGRKLDSLRVHQCVDSVCSYQGLNFMLTPDIWQLRSRVNFKVKHFQGTVETLGSKLRINTDQTGTFMSITLKDKNPELCARTVNMLLDIFRNKSREIDYERRQFFSDYINDQLKNVKAQLDKTDYQEELFRNKYPRGLDYTIKETADRLSTIETDKRRQEMSKAELDTLLSRLDYRAANLSVGDADRFIIRQIASLPVFEYDPNMLTARGQLAELDGRKNAALDLYPENNPEVRELSERISQIEMEVVRLARAMVKRLEVEIADKERQLNEEDDKLQNLPSEAMQQIRYTRQRRANEEIYNTLLRRLREAEIAEDLPSETIDIRSARVPNQAIDSDKMKNIVMGLFFGFSLGIGVVIVMEFADKRIRTQDDVKRYMKMSVLGIIPTVKFDHYELQDSEKAKSISSQIVTHDYSPTPVGEAYRSLRTSLLFSKTIGPIRSLAIGSVSPSEGKSFTAANLAITLAQQKSKTLLIDADLRRGVLHNTFNCPKKPGLTNYLTGVVPLESVLNETYIPNLTLITCGSLIPNPSELLGSVKMKRFIEGITKRFDFVLFDTPPLNAATDAIILGTLVDGIAVLVRAGYTNRDDVRRKMELFQNVNVRILGAILNCAGVEIAHEGYSYYRY
jgi:tyrosine-protein kinase Etk/Wzc